MPRQRASQSNVSLLHGRCSPLGVGVLWLAALSGSPGCFNPGSDDLRDEEPAPTSTTEAELEGTSAGDDTGAPDDADDDDADGSSSDDGSDPAPVQEACETYCSLMDDHCDDTFPQYSGELACRSVCEQMDVGTPEDTLGNTVGCRTHHAFLAARSPQTHCFHAGPTGDGTCGATCESFCGLALRTCPDGLTVWEDAEACISDCQSWSPEPRYTADVPDDDTYACRMRHLTLAVLQPEVHCAHIGPDSPICVAP